MNIEEMEDKAVRFLDEDKIVRAERVLKQMLRYDPKCLAAHFHLARVYRRTEQYKWALRHGHKVLEFNKNEPNANLNLGIVYDLIGDDRRALRHYKKELLLNPHSAETEWNIGRLYFSKHRWLDASRHLKHCFDMGFQSKLADTVHKLGFCFFKLGDTNAYIELYTRYVQLEPGAAWAFANLGCAMLHVHKYKSAILRLTRAVKLGAKRKYTAELKHARKMLVQALPTTNVQARVS